MGNYEEELGTGMPALDYLESKEKDIFDKIWAIASTGTSDDKTKLDALKILYNKVRPDRTKLEVDVKSKAPYEILLRNIKDEQV